MLLDVKDLAETLLSVLLVRDNMAMLGSRIPTLPPATIDGDVGGGEEYEFMQLQSLIFVLVAIQLSNTHKHCTAHFISLAWS